MPTIWNCPRCGKETYRECTTCPSCGLAFPTQTENREDQATYHRGGIWTCGSCGAENFPEDLTCNACGLRPVGRPIEYTTTRSGTANRANRRGPLARKMVKGSIGFVTAFAAVLVIEILVLYGIGDALDSRLVPRGLGWLVLPVLAGLAGWTLFKELPFETAAESALKVLFANTRLNRFLLATHTSWVIVVSAYVFFAEPFGYSMRGSEWLDFLQVIFVPPIVLTIVVFMYRWALQR